MKHQLNKKLTLSFLLLALLCLSVHSSAFTLIINSNVKYEYLAILEHISTNPQKLTDKYNELKLENYPNAVYLIYSKSIKTYSVSNPKFLAMIWVDSDTSTIEITIDKDYNVSFKNENEYQRELNEIFKASDIWQSFPYEPKPDKPLEPILALEAKALIQNLDIVTETAVLENLYKLSRQRNINNWSTAIIAAYLKEPPNALYDKKARKLLKIKGLDSLQNYVEVKPDGKKYLLVILSGSWCGPCVKGLPKLRNIYDSVSDNFLFVSAWNDTDLNTFKYNHRDKKKVISWPSLWDQYGLMANALQINAYPTYILFDSQGNEIKRWEGKVPNNLKDYISN